MTPNDPRRPQDINDPDAQNAEQEDAGSQAQDVAEDALRHPWRRGAAGESSHGGKSDPTQLVPDDTQDVVDHMTDMDRSGRIDMGAFEGEENMDDEDGSIPE
ncbi:MAG: hypothetical protein BGP16_03775 [Sphingobium sp. 66-54]|nr:MAG: hypothetical protein BGP16_03775 [Sphingobium sp. 66-54]